MHSQRKPTRLKGSFTTNRKNPYYDGPPSDHYDGERFFLNNPLRHISFGELLRWRLSARPAWPRLFPSPFQDKPPVRSDHLRVSFIGHASFLYQISGLNVLIDPVYALRVGPGGRIGPKRINPPGISFDDLPPIDAILITHNHYDHLDGPCLARLWQRDQPRIIAPLGNDTIIRRYGRDIRVESMDWGDQINVSAALTIDCVPTVHWSARGFKDRCQALWGSYILRDCNNTIYHIGDTGFGDGATFRQVRDQFGTPDLAVLPIGAYEPRWFMQDQHINPREAVDAVKLCGAHQALGHHWATFHLANEAVKQPAEDLSVALRDYGIDEKRFLALRPGQVWQPAQK